MYADVHQANIICLRRFRFFKTSYMAPITLEMTGLTVGSYSAQVNASSSRPTLLSSEQASGKAFFSPPHILASISEALRFGRNTKTLGRH